MPFGVSSASEEYQIRMREALKEFLGIAILANDILVHGRGNADDEARENHDRNLEELLRCQ